MAATPTEVIKVALQGEIDIETVKDARGTLQEACVLDPAATVLVDMSAVTFIDSTGLGMLVGASRRMRAAGGDLRLTDPSPRVLIVIELTGLSGTLLVPTPEDGDA